jgi:hypothetical protein
MLRWKYLCFCILGSMAIISSSGCSVFRTVQDYIDYNDTCNDFVIGYRNEVWAKQSWHDNKSCFADQPYLKDFGKGYQAGYADVANGGSGCPPALPPRSYWKWHYQSPEGQAKVAAWFAGYPHGAATAERDNAGAWQEIQVSHQIETQYSAEFQNGTIFLPDEVLEEYGLERPCCPGHAAGGACTCGQCGAGCGGAVPVQDLPPDQHEVAPQYQPDAAALPALPRSMHPDGQTGYQPEFAYAPSYHR